MDKKMLEELAEERLTVEKAIIEEESKLNVLGGQWDSLKAEINKMKVQKARLSTDIRSVCQEKKPTSSNYIKEKLKIGGIKNE